MRFRPVNLKTIAVILIFLILSILKMCIKPVIEDQFKIVGIYATIVILSYAIADNLIDLIVTIRNPPPNIPEKILLESNLFKIMIIVASIVSTYFVLMYT